jgi:hypothetical protein
MTSPVWSNESHMCWNCRAVGRSSTVQDLVRLVQVRNPKIIKIIFLSETKQSDERVKNLRWRRLDLKNCLTVEKEGIAGGLALLWDNSVVVDLQTLGERHIDILIRAVENSV